MAIPYRNVLIVFIATTTACLFYWYFIETSVIANTIKKNEEFGTSSFGQGENARLTELRKELRGVQRKFRLDPPDIPESEEPDVVAALKELSRDLKNRDEQWRWIFAQTLRQPPN